MGKQLNKKELVQALWETGTKKVKTLQNKVCLPTSTLYEWVKKLKKGISLFQNNYPQRKKKISKTQQIKVVRMLQSKKQPSLRQISNAMNISHESVREMYPDGYIFQQDGNPCHTAKIVDNYISQSIDNKIEWPPNSPDLSPIENIWAWLKRQVAADYPKSISSLKKSVQKHWSSMTPEFLDSYKTSMENRINEVIKKQGNRIDY